jgi:hypothetical protein
MWLTRLGDNPGVLRSDTGWQGRAAPTDVYDVGRLQILRNAPGNPIGEYGVR